MPGNRSSELKVQVDGVYTMKRLAVLPELVAAMERHDHLDLDPEVRERLLSASGATIDRLRGPIRNEVRSRRRRRKPPKANRAIPVRTFADWNGPDPGYLEIDFVLHCGDSTAGSFIHTLVATDVCSGWTKCLALLAREQPLVVEGLEVLIRQIPFPVLGIDSDNDAAFVNDTLVEFCRMHKLAFTRCRSYHKNDQAWVEQKNGSVARRLVGHQRFSGFIEGQTLAHLYHHARLYVNYFQPSFKLREKVRHGGKVKRTYDQPATPCARLLTHPAVDDKIKEILRRQRAQLDPLQLLHRLRESQAALAVLVSPDRFAEGQGRKTLDQFLSQLPELWRSGEVRPTHRIYSANHAISEPGKILSRRSGSAYLRGCSVTLTPEPKSSSIAFNRNIPGFSHVVSSEHSSVASKNGDRSWQKSLSTPAWMEPRHQGLKPNVCGWHNSR